MSNRNDERVLNAILNPNTPFEDSELKPTTESKYEANSAINEAKSLEIEGVKAAQAGDLKKSIETFSKAIELAPHWASSYNNRAQALRLSGDTDQAWNDLEKAIDLSKEFNDHKVLALALTQKGTILRLKGKDDEAIECFKVASSCGNCFAKQQVVSMNPYAALCNQMLSDVFEKIKKGESY